MISSLLQQLFKLVPACCKYLCREKKSQNGKVKRTPTYPQQFHKDCKWKIKWMHLLKYQRKTHYSRMVKCKQIFESSNAGSFSPTWISLKINSLWFILCYFSLILFAKIRIWSPFRQKAHCNVGLVIILIETKLNLDYCRSFLIIYILLTQILGRISVRRDRTYNNNIYLYCTISFKIQLFILRPRTDILPVCSQASLVYRRFTIRLKPPEDL